MIEVATIVAVIVLFFHSCTWPGMVFHFVDKALIKLPDYLTKPLYSCPICMAIWWGVPVQCVGMLWCGWNITSISQVLMINACAAGINLPLNYSINYFKGGKKDCNCERKKRLGLI